MHWLSPLWQELSRSTIYVEQKVLSRCHQFVSGLRQGFCGFHHANLHLEVARQ
jgi:hypothetical protein